FSANRRRGLGAGESARGLLADLRMLAALPTPAAFENFAPGARSGDVLYQTRVWAPEPSTDDLEALNRERAELVRELRAAFPDAFAGGIVADAFSTAHFPGLVTRRSLHRAEYAAMSRRAAIGIYSRGLHHSLAFKLSEYLAGGLCVVSTPLAHELPAPLVPGRHYLEYRTPAECVAAVGWLRAHPEAADRMRRENVDYYRTNLAPAPFVVSLLERAFRARG
ncbi:MAG TPA: glycosyltransferase, partial [Elusimicrobiota bacterium]|nr:glycosyltransferase [Elusimicrobiota bacterium]